MDQYSHLQDKQYAPAFYPPFEQYALKTEMEFADTVVRNQIQELHT